MNVVLVVRFRWAPVYNRVDVIVLQSTVAGRRRSDHDVAHVRSAGRSSRAISSFLKDNDDDDNDGYDDDEREHKADCQT